MKQVTSRQVITLLLMTATLALILGLMPEQPKQSAQTETTTRLLQQAAK